MDRSCKDSEWRVFKRYDRVEGGCTAARNVDTVQPHFLALIVVVVSVLTIGAAFQPINQALLERAQPELVVLLLRPFHYRPALQCDLSRHPFTSNQISPELPHILPAPHGSARL
jgi:hypothetical protein